WLARLVAGRVLELGAELADSFRDPPREFLELALAGGGLSRPAGGLEGALAPLVRSSGTRAGRVGRARVGRRLPASRSGPIALRARVAARVPVASLAGRGRILVAGALAFRVAARP